MESIGPQTLLVDVEELGRRVAREAATAETIARAAADLTSDPLGLWWHDGRASPVSGLAAEVLADLRSGADALDGFAADALRRIGEVGHAELVAARHAGGTT